MEKTVLFSPLGGTDPISNDRDGSFIHICRIYRPDKVYLFMSKEICKFHNKDNRYIYCLEKLGEMLQHKFEYELIMEPELADVHDYNIFYSKFRKMLDDIYSENMGAGDGADRVRILLNTSSGTPAMKSALHVIAEISEKKYLPVQVSTPERSMNPHRENKKEYDVVYYWKNNLDNEEEFFENRCAEVECENLTVLLKCDMIKKFVKAYDYNAALMVADEIKDDLTEDAYNMIAAAAARLQLDLRTYTSRIGKVDKIDFMPVKSGNHRKITEYLLSLEIKIKKNELVDFLRGITPVIVDLFKEVLFKQYGIKIEDYCDERAKNLRWDENKLKADKELYDLLSDGYNGNFQPGNVSSDNFVKIITGEQGGKASMKQLVCDLRDVETAVRNTAAHEIVSITEEYLKTKTRNIKNGLTSKEIFKMLKEMCVYAGLPGGDKIWNSYDEMNNIIISHI